MVFLDVNINVDNVSVYNIHTETDRCEIKTLVHAAVTGCIVDNRLKGVSKIPTTP